MKTNRFYPFCEFLLQSFRAPDLGRMEKLSADLRKVPRPYLYGSDDFDVEGDCIRPTVLHNFFEEEGEHDYVGHPYRSIKLSEATLQNIYHDSAYRLYGEPKEGNLPLLLEMAEEIRAKIEPSSDEMKELDTIVEVLMS